MLRMQKSTPLGLQMGPVECSGVENPGVECPDVDAGVVLDLLRRSLQSSRGGGLSTVAIYFSFD